MDIVRSCVGLGPVAIYLLLLGAVNLSRRPLITTGARDIAALGVAAAGLVMIGPVELLMPPMMVAGLGWQAWLLVLGLYSSALTLFVLLLPPRLVIYNISLDQLHEVLAQAARRVDGAAHWAGNTFVLPNRNVQFILQTFPTLRNVSLAATGEHQNHQAWRELDVALRQDLAKTDVGPNPRGLTMVGVGVLILGIVAFRWVSNPQAVTQGFIDMLGL